MNLARITLSALVLLAGIGLFLVTSGAGETKPDLMKQAEEHMVGNGEQASLQGAYWAMEQGPKVVPVLAKMLTRQKLYEKKYDNAVGAFPFNALWVLSHFKTTSALSVLQHYYAQSKDKEALLAINGWKSRSKYGNSAGVLINDHDLLSGSSEESKVLAHLSAGEPVIDFKTVDNDKEEDARGGPTQFDRIRVIRTKQVGYIERASDDFDPTF
ncbi:MAG TPA: hypothetical protein VFW40_12955 [Capsulimonadaceae bacterium]|nr:hypothetical protein [Capsulimonadaceae bacterium]